MGIISLIPLVSLLFLLFPKFHSNDIFQNLFYVVILVIISSILYITGLVINRLLDIEDYEQKISNYNNELSDKKEKIDKLSSNNKDYKENISSLKNKIDKLKEQNNKLNSGTVKIKDNERGIYLEVNGKEIDNPQLKEMIQITLDRYKHSNEEERKKWDEEFGDKLSHMKV